jgi:hypothetical protein
MIVRMIVFCVALQAIVPQGAFGQGLSNLPQSAQVAPRTTVTVPNWVKRHPFLTGAIAGAGGGGIVAVVACHRQSGPDPGCSRKVAPFGAMIGSLVGLTVSGAYVLFR